MTTIGFVGLGNMGLPMATRLRDAGVELVVNDTRTEVVRAFAGGKVSAGQSPREVADRSDIVFMSLPTPAAVRDVVGGEQGLVHGRRAKLVADLSTTGPTLAREAAGLLGPAGIAFMDAPVSGGVTGAQKGTLTVMCSGALTDHERALPFLQHIGRVVRVGDAAGQGQAMKVLNNMLSATAMVATSEVMVLGVKAGLDPAVMLDVLNTSSGRNTATADKFPRCVLDRSFNFGFRSVLFYKDVHLCQQFAHEFGVPFAVGDAVDKIWERAARELGDGDFTRVVELVERGAGVQVGAAPSKE